LAIFVPKEADLLYGDRFLGIHRFFSCLFHLPSRLFIYAFSVFGSDCEFASSR
jgi:hypothetical protein